MEVRQMKDLPNQHGYEFYGITLGGKKVQCYVHQNSDTGLHEVRDMFRGRPCFKELKGWQEKPAH